MIACLDVQYDEGTGRAAAVVIDDWTADTARAAYCVSVAVDEEYKSGEFYRRELAPLLEVIDQIKEDIDVFVVDAYCQLDEKGSPGLGAHLQAALGPDVTVIGVAKNRYRDSRHAEEVLRGGSDRPLFVTAVGMSADAAATNIASMAGPYRVPKLLKQVDRLARRADVAASGS